MDLDVRRKYGDRGLCKINRALISVYDKSNVVELGKCLQGFGVDILSTSKTLKALQDADVPAREISQESHFPEILDGRVKTINPRIAAGILAIRGNEEHMRVIDEHKIKLIDLIVVNFYPFEEAVRKHLGFAETKEQIDIGGPSMVMEAVKNFEDVTVITDPTHYTVLMELMRVHNGSVPTAFRFKMARKAARAVADYREKNAAYFEEFNSIPPDLEDRC